MSYPQHVYIVSERVRISVLHVDDDPALGDLTAEMLEREDERIEVTAVSSVSDGLSAVRTTGVDCVVSDYDMPDQTGIEFLHTVRADYPDLPFILFTGKGSEAVASDAFSGGATDYLQKDPGSDQYTVLANKITNAVERYRAEKTLKRRAQAMRTADEGIAIVGEGGQYIEVNDAYAELYGSTRSALTGEHWTVTVPETEVEKVQQEIFPHLREHGHWKGEVVGQQTDGEQYPKTLSLSLLENGGHVCVAQDISEQKQREHAIEDLHATARDLIGAETVDQVATTAVNALRDALELPVAGLHLYDEADGLVPVAWTDATEDLIGTPSTLGTDEGIIGPVFESGEVRVDDDISGVEDRYNPDTDIRSQIVVPLADHGVIIVGSDTVADFDETDVDLVRTVATHVTTALERIERERTLEEERQFVQQALDAIDDLFYVVDTDGTLRRWNSRVPEVTGYSDTELEDKNATALFPTDEQPTVADALSEVADTGEAIVEADLLTEDGTRVPYEFTGSRVTDTAGDVTGVIGIGRDISKRKMREEIVADLHDATQDLITAPDPQTVADQAVATAQRVLEQPINGIWLYDSDAESLQPAGMTDVSASLVDEQPTYTDGGSLSWQAFEAGELAVYTDLQTEPQRLNEETTIRSEVIAPLGEYGVMNFGSTAPDAFSQFEVSVIRTLTKNVEAALDRASREQQLLSQRAELERQNERLEKFTSVVSHDLRNPLQVAEGRAKLAQTTGDTENLEAVLDAHERMRTLIEDLLTIAREGRQVEDTEPVALSEIASGCWQRVAADEATLSCETALELNADPGRLKQILENLFANAVEHAGAGVTVEVGSLADSDGFYVADDGPGIPAEEREAVFDVGYSTGSDGTGFGLNIVNEIVDAHGWEVAVVDAESGGARFEIAGVDTQ